jgi:hypothetical protein
MKNTRAEMNAAQPPREGGVARRRFLLRVSAALLLLAFCAVAALPLFAADAWTTLDAGQGLDVRDERNQPVSRAEVESRVRAGSVALLRQASATERLGALGALLELLERGNLLCPVLRGGSASPRLREASSCVLRESKARAVKAPTVHAAPVPGAAPVLDPQSQAASRRILLFPLRC